MKKPVNKKRNEPKTVAITEHEYLFGSEGHLPSVFKCPCRPSVTGNVITHGRLSVPSHR